MISKPASSLPYRIYVITEDVDKKQVISNTFADGNKQCNKDNRGISVRQGKIIPERVDNNCKDLLQDRTWHALGMDRSLM